jgi:LysR family transcriptional regulator, nitrogen assimilation regulatory protein
MDLKQLRYLVAIIQCGSITRASMQLNVAQPALSLHMRNMEADLGVQLLFRTSQGVQPTEAGRILMRNAQLILGQFEQAQAEIRGSLAEPAGNVRMGLPSSISHILGVPLILAARKRHPKINLTIAEAMSGYVFDWLRVGRVDLGLLYNLVEDRGLRAISLLSEGLVLFGRSNGSAATEPPEDGPAPIATLADRPLILPSMGHGLRDFLDEKAAASGLRLMPTIEIDAFSAIKTLVKLGLGYSVLPAHAVQKEVDEKELVAWPFDPPLVRTVHLVLPTDRPLSHAAGAVERLCRVTLADLVGSGVWRSAQMRITT